jgi:Na+/melibiose symporter-like transporter
VEQSLMTKRAISIAFAGLPFLTMIAIVAMLSRFQLDETTHARIRAALTERGGSPPTIAAQASPSAVA